MQFCYKGGRRKWHFLKPKLEVKETQLNKELQLQFNMAVALKRYNMKLWRNGVGIAAPAENRRFPPNFFAFYRQIRQFSFIWDKLFFS